MPPMPPMPCIIDAKSMPPMPPMAPMPPMPPPKSASAESSFSSSASSSTYLAQSHWIHATFCFCWVRRGQCSSSAVFLISKSSIERSRTTYFDALASMSLNVAISAVNAWLSVPPFPLNEKPFSVIVTEAFFTSWTAIVTKTRSRR
eukprot:Amastigsp_a846652_794.p3 type:complete len:146 gc:universal Amastigsp_a846652_794:2-439(+)